MKHLLISFAAILCVCQAAYIKVCFALLLPLAFCKFATTLLFVFGLQYAGIPNDKSLSVAWKNGAILNETLRALRPGDELFFAPNTTYHLVGGIMASNLQNNIIHFDGTLIFTDNIETWPRTASGQVLECMNFMNIKNVTFTSSTRGVIDGSGEAWWGLIGYLLYQENRPRLLSIGSSSNLLIENLFFRQSPYWTVWIYNVDGLEIRFSEISNRRNDYDGHDNWNLLYAHFFRYYHFHKLIIVQARLILMDLMYLVVMCGFTMSPCGIRTIVFVLRIIRRICSLNA